MKDIFKNTYKILNNKLYFILLYMISSLVFVTSLSFIPGIKVITKIAILWGVILIPINIIEKIIRREKLQLIKIPLYAFLLITLYLNIFKYPTIENLKIWIINVMIFTIFFSIDTNKDRKTLIKEINTISYVYTISTFILSLISIIIIIINKPIIYKFFDVNGVEKEFIYCGLFSNENSLSIAAVIAIVFSIYLFFNTKSKVTKNFLWINVIIQIITFIVGGGRSSYFILLALLFVFLFIYIKNIIFRIALIVLPSVSSIAYIYYNMDKLHYIFTGRENIWYTAFYVIKRFPIIGTGNSDLLKNIESMRDSSIYLRGIEYGSLHNVYIEVATVNGIISALLIILFLIITFLVLVKKIAICNRHNKISYTILFSLFVGIALINLMESGIIYNVSFITIIFWSILGYLFSLVNSENNK